MLARLHTRQGFSDARKQVSAARVIQRGLRHFHERGAADRTVLAPPPPASPPRVGRREGEEGSAKRPRTHG